MRNSVSTQFLNHSVGLVTQAPSAPPPLPDNVTGLQRSRSLPNLAHRVSGGPVAPRPRNALPAQNILICDGEITPQDKESDTSSVITNITDCLKNRGIIDDVPEPVGEVDMSTLEIQKNNILGGGQFGVVYCGSVFVDKVKTPCAVKLPNIKGDKNQEVEAKTLAGLNHKNVIKTFGFHEEDNAIVFELAKTTVAELIKAIEYLPKEKKIAINKAMIYQMVCGAFHIFRRRVLHMDLKAENILYSETGVISLADFGLVMKFPDKEYASSKMKDIILKLNYDNCGIPERDVKLMENLFIKYKITRGGEAQKSLRNDFIELYTNSKNWNCLTPAELAEEINPLL
jgi:Protein kinase domain